MKITKIVIDAHARLGKAIDQGEKFDDHRAFNVLMSMMHKLLEDLNRLHFAEQIESEGKPCLKSEIKKSRRLV